MKRKTLVFELAPPLALGLLLGWVYWRTLLPGVGYWGDMAKFQFLGQVLGTPHLSGYPTYVILNALFVRLAPFGSLALRANLLSALFGVGAALFLYAAMRRLGISAGAAFLAALSFGFTYSIWEFSLAAEVYSLHAFFVAAVIFWMLCWHFSRRDRYLYLACGFYAFSFGNHLTMIALLPAIVYLVWVTDRTVFWSGRRILVIGSLIVLAFAQYGYIAWRTLDPQVRFLEIDTATLLEFMRRPWGSQSAFKAGFWELLRQRLPAFLGYTWREYSLLLAAALWGVFRLRPPAVNRFLLLGLGGALLFGLNFDVRETWVYFLPVYEILAIYLGAAIHDLAQRLEAGLRRAAAARSGRLAAWAGRRAGWLALLPWLAAPLLLLGLHYQALDQSQHVLHARIVERALTEAGSRAILVADEYDYLNYFWYYLLGEGYEQRRLYATSLQLTHPEQLRSYLAGSEPLRIPVVRQQAPSGLRVLALWRLADRLRQEGFSVRPTGVKYLVEVTLPGAAP